LQCDEAVTSDRPFAGTYSSRRLDFSQSEQGTTNCRQASLLFCLNFKPVNQN